MTTDFTPNRFSTPLETTSTTPEMQNVEELCNFAIAVLQNNNIPPDTVIGRVELEGGQKYDIKKVVKSGELELEIHEVIHGNSQPEPVKVSKTKMIEILDQHINNIIKKVEDLEKLAQIFDIGAHYKVNVRGEYYVFENLDDRVRIRKQSDFNEGKETGLTIMREGGRLSNDYEFQGDPKCLEMVEELVVSKEARERLQKIKSEKQPDIQETTQTASTSSTPTVQTPPKKTTVTKKSMIGLMEKTKENKNIDGNAVIGKVTLEDFTYEILKNGDIYIMDSSGNRKRIFSYYLKNPIVYDIIKQHAINVKEKLESFEKMIHGSDDIQEGVIHEHTCDDGTIYEIKKTRNGYHIQRHEDFKHNRPGGVFVTNKGELNFDGDPRALEALESFTEKMRDLYNSAKEANSEINIGKKTFTLTFNSINRKVTLIAKGDKSSHGVELSKDSAGSIHLDKYRASGGAGKVTKATDIVFNEQKKLRAAKKQTIIDRITITNKQIGSFNTISGNLIDSTRYLSKPNVELKIDNEVIVVDQNLTQRPKAMDRLSAVFKGVYSMIYGDDEGPKKSKKILENLEKLKTSPNYETDSNNFFKEILAELQSTKEKSTDTIYKDRAVLLLLEALFAQGKSGLNEVMASTEFLNALPQSEHDEEFQCPKGRIARKFEITKNDDGTLSITHEHTIPILARDSKDDEASHADFQTSYTMKVDPSSGKCGNVMLSRKIIYKDEEGQKIADIIKDRLEKAQTEYGVTLPPTNIEFFLPKAETLPLHT